MEIRLIGANPGLTLYADGAERPTAFASVWRVDWSTAGAGTALVLWHDGQTRVLSSSPDLGVWLAEEFTRHFPETAKLPWSAPQVTATPVTLEQDLAQGIRATAGDVEIEITEPLDRRLVRVDDFDLGGTPHVLSTVLMPCRSGTLRIAGTPVPGEPRVRTEPRTSSTAFLADAEVWGHQPLSR